MSYSGKLFGVIPYEVRDSDTPHYKEEDIEAMLGIHYGSIASALIFVESVFNDDKHAGNILRVDCIYDNDKDYQWFGDEEEGVALDLHIIGTSETQIKYAHQIEYAVRHHFTNDTQLTLIDPEDVDQLFDFATQAEAVDMAKRFVDEKREMLNEIIESETPGRVGILIRAKLAGIEFKMYDDPNDIIKRIEQHLRSKENIVKRACKELGITQKELADMLGVSKPSVERWAQVDTPDQAIKQINMLLENISLKRELEELKNAIKTITKYVN